MSILKDVFDGCPTVVDPWFLTHGFADCVVHEMYVIEELGGPAVVDPAISDWNQWLDPEKYPVGLIRRCVTIGSQLKFDPPKNSSVLKAYQEEYREDRARIVEWIEKKKREE